MLIDIYYTFTECCPVYKSGNNSVKKILINMTNFIAKIISFYANNLFNDTH